MPRKIIDPQQSTLRLDAGFQVCTSNFASVKSLPPGVLPLSIARGTPGWFKGQRDLRLAPTRDMLAMDWDDYDRLYFQILDQHDAEEYFDDLKSLGAPGVALLCWCARGNCCHRRYVAEWLEVHLSIEVPEHGLPRDAVETFLKWK
jgi:hypothetical protein